MSGIKLTIHRGWRLHFCLEVGLYEKWFPLRLNNKEKMMMHLIKDLRWRVEFFDGERTKDCYEVDQIELEADVEDGLAEDLENALKALMKAKSLRRDDLERLKAMPLRDACKELVAMFVLEG